MPHKVCAMEQVKEVRQPWLVGEPERYDFEYERNGVSNLFSLEEPLRGWRHVEVTDQRTAIDWAYQIRDLVDIYYPYAYCISLVMDIFICVPFIELPN